MANVIINDSYKHFIVIYEINFKKKYLIIGDPSDKIKKITYEDFKKIFNCVLIICYPIKKIHIEKNISISKLVFFLINSNSSLVCFNNESTHLLINFSALYIGTIMLISTLLIYPPALF